mmetsp:Transcript_247/g.493  ORF Transcript_247/g.493 Transcript_247/m.493 type:complete len:223 (-) Transcript_247:516-1184(-)
MSILATSGSSPLLTRPFTASPRMRTVTEVVSPTKIFAYSSAMMPPPWITMLFGRKESPLIVSESKTRSSLGRLEGTIAEEPVAMRMFSAETSRASPMSSTRTDMRLLPFTVAHPVRRLTPKSRSWLTEWSAFESASSVHMAWTCIQIVSSWICMLRSSDTLSCFPTSRSALENSPVGPPRKGLLSASLPPLGASMSSTRFPMYAALSAAWTPVGPPPMTARS